MRPLLQLERLLMILGVLLLALFAGARIHRTVLSNAELRSFQARQVTAIAGPRGITLTPESPNFSLWSKQRIQGYQESLAEHFAPAIAILRIPRIQLEVPVLEGTDDLTLNRGVGHVAGTPNPGESGNIAIAGHRDGFFRGLKDVELGDKIGIVMPERTETYTIDQITIVDRHDVSVLQPRPHQSLTLITCYPFYFIGSAPQRYIVQASLAESALQNPGTARQQWTDRVVLASKEIQDQQFRTNKLRDSEFVVPKAN